MKKIFLLGSINIDLVFKSNRSPLEGETIFGDDFFINPGGKGANQAYAASKLGGSVIMCGSVGDDLFGEKGLNNLKDIGVETKFIKRNKNLSTGVASINVVNGNNRIIVVKGANDLINKNDIDIFLSSSSKGDIFLCQLELNIDICKYALEIAHFKGMTVILNPAPIVNSINTHLKYVDILIPNEIEVKNLNNIDLFLSNGGVLITTLGKDGYSISTIKESKFFPAIKVKAIDSTAAGDTFCGAFASKLSMGLSIFESAHFASIAASLSVTKKGAQNSIPSEKEVITFLNKN